MPFTLKGEPSALKAMFQRNIVSQASPFSFFHAKKLSTKARITHTTQNTRQSFQVSSALLIRKYCTHFKEKTDSLPERTGEAFSRILRLFLYQHQSYSFDSFYLNRFIGSKQFTQARHKYIKAA